MYPFERNDEPIKFLSKVYFSGEFTMLKLEKIPEQENYPLDFIFAVVDTETSGLDPKNDKLIEVCVSCFGYCDGELRKISGGYSGLQDPGFPLSETIKKVTGLTDEDLAGKSIDKKALENAFDGVSFVVAHNANFDKSFLEAFLAGSDIKIPDRWACSSSDIPWSDWGVSSRKLDYLCMIHGFYYDAHRAQIDVDALGLLLSFCDPEGRGLIEYLRDAAKDSRHTINAFVRFEDKDIVKSNGFYWNAELKSWDRTVTGANLKDCLDWLNQNLPTCKTRVTEILPKA